MSPRSIASAGAVMAAGTILSRLTGFVRVAVMAATLGVLLTADVFTLPNTIPNSLYILVAGGVLNAVLVPQLVRSMKDDPDGGEAYAQRLTTAVVLVLLAATAACVLAAPWLVRLYANEAFLQPELRPQFDAMVAFARVCLPQIFFYGIYVLLGQMLNARGSFGPMMWAPVLNNLIAIAVFAGYLVAYGPKDPRSGLYSTGEVLWFGLGSTAGIAVQALVLLPVLHRTGLRLRLRGDLRGVGLARAARLGSWTVLFVVVNQLTYVVVTRLATGGSAGGDDAGLTAYSGAFLVTQLPHGVITVSLATALLPAMSRHAVEGDLDRLRDDLAATQRQSLALVLPSAVLVAALAVPLADLIFGYGAAAGDVGQVAAALVAFAPGMVLFAIQFLALRGFYALEDTRTPFLVQFLVVAVVNVAAALLLVPVSPSTPAALAAAWSLAYLAAVLVTLRLLSRRLGRPVAAGLVRHLVRLSVCALPAGGVAFGLATLLQPLGRGSQWLAAVVLLGSAGPALGTYLLLARLLHVREVRQLVSSVTRRARRSG